MIGKQETTKHRFYGMNMDDDVHSPTTKWDEDYRYALNIRSGSSEENNVGVVENIKGTTLVSFTLPVGNNTCIGSYEDRLGDSVIYFIHNSNGDHGIYRFFADTNTVSKVFEWSGLNFSLDHLITGCGLIGSFLGFTDNYNPPRMVDLERIGTYSTPYSEEMISLAKRPPIYPPTFVLKHDANYKQNNLKYRHFQFRTRFVYLDGTKSVASPISKMADNTVDSQVDKTQEPILLKIWPGEENYIEIDLNVSEFFDAEWFGTVKKIEILVSESNGPFGVFRVVERDTLLVDDKFKFYNNEAIGVISDRENLKLSDAVPILSRSLSVTKNRFFLGGNTERGGNGSGDISVSCNYKKEEDIQLGSRIYKDKGLYQFGVVFYDEYMRSSGVLTSEGAKIEISNTFYTNTNFTGLQSKRNRFFENRCYSVTVDLSNITPPLWARYYQVVRTKDIRHGYFMPISITSMSYVGDYDINTNEPYYDNNSLSPLAAHVGWDAGLYHDLFYNFTEGDFICINNNHQLIKGLYDKEVKERILNSTNIPRTTVGSVIENNSETIADVNKKEAYYDYSTKTTTVLVTEADNDFGILSNTGYSTIGYLYRPAVNTGVFYEIDTVRKISSGLLDDVSIEIGNGDVFLSVRTFKSSIPKPRLSNRPGSYEWGISPAEFKVHFYTESMSEFYVDYEDYKYNTGRVNAILSDDKEVYKETAIRFGNPYVDESNINGLSTFDPLDEEILPAEYGEINKLQVSSNNQGDGNVLLSIHENEVVSVYIGEKIIKDNSGQELLATSESVIGTYRSLRGGYGTVNPESVVQHDGRVYGYDRKRGIAWRYSQDGLTPISMIKCNTYFKHKNFLGNVYGGYDPYHEQYILSFNNDDTIAWSEALKRWVSFYSFNPEGYQKVNSKLVGFKNGQLWLHNSNNTYNNFYGAQYESKITTITNTYPSNPKTFAGHGVESNKKWVAASMATPEDQYTRLYPANYDKLENMYYAQIMRDINSKGNYVAGSKPALFFGDTMCSRVLETEIENTDTEKALLYASNINFLVSKGHEV